jgi:hypothetical protein
MPVEKTSVREPGNLVLWIDLEVFANAAKFAHD